MSYRVSIVIEHDEYGYYAYSPELEGCQTQGDSLEEIMGNMKEAIELYLETLSEEEVILCGQVLRPDQQLAGVRFENLTPHKKHYFSS